MSLVKLNGEHIDKGKIKKPFIKFQIHNLLDYYLLYAGAVFTGMIFIPKGLV